MITEDAWIKRKWPLLLSSLLFAHTVFQVIKTITNQVLLIDAHVNNDLLHFFLFGDPLYPGKIESVLLIIVIIISWLFSTRISVFQQKGWRIAQFFMMIIGVVSMFLWHVTSNTYQYVIPYLSERLAEAEVETAGMMDVLFTNTEQFFWLLVSLPYLVMCLIALYMGGLFTKEQKELVPAFMEYQWSGRWLQRISNIEKKEIWPDVELGPDVNNNEVVVQPGRDRTLNGIIIGSIGTGKTAALGLPIINQDLHHITRFINSYPKISRLENYHSEEVKGMYLNGISIIEPSNDLCQKSYQLVKAHGIPEESITYINPLDKNTPAINPMKGPVDKVAEAFAMVIEGLNESGDGGNFYFEQSQRNHLKHYVYLLKLHVPEQEVTFDMLLDMYNNSQLVRRMHVILKSTIPDDIDLMEDRDERNHWKIVQQIDEWFDQNLLPKMVRSGQGEVPEKIQEGKYRGEDKYYDAKAEHVQGLRNILNDVGANPLIRRVLFGKSDFDFDLHLEKGGVLLVNTAKGELSNLANVLGKIVLLSLQNAVFRRPPNVSTFHHILVDEAPDYLYQPFREFPAQSRKYKVIVTIIMQTVAQLADRYGEHYMETLIGTLRNRYVYGDLPAFDAEYFSRLFGEKWEYEESTTEMSVSPLQDNPQTRAGSSFQKKKEVAFTEADIMFQREFECAVKIVVNNRPMPVRRIKANFVPKEQFKRSAVIVNEEAAKIWLEERAAIGPIEMELVADPIEEVEEVLEKEVEVKQSASAELDLNELEESISQQHDEMPKDSVIYHHVPPTSRLRSKRNKVESDHEPQEVESPVVVSDNVMEEEKIVSVANEDTGSKSTVVQKETAPTVYVPKAKPVSDETLENQREEVADWSATLKFSQNEEAAATEMNAQREPEKKSKLPNSEFTDKNKEFFEGIVQFANEE